MQRAINKIMYSIRVVSWIAIKRTNITIFNDPPLLKTIDSIATTTTTTTTTTTLQNPGFVARTLSFCSSLCHDTCFGAAADTILGRHSSMEIRSIHLGGMFHAEEEVQMTSMMPHFVGHMQGFVYNGHRYISVIDSQSAT